MADPQKKLDPILFDLSQQLSTGFLEGEFTVQGHVFKMRTLNEDDLVWRDKFADISSMASYASSIRAPTLGVAIVSVDGKTVTELFERDWLEQEDVVRKLLEAAPNGKKNFFSEKLYKYLASQPSAFVRDLWEVFNKLANRETAAQGKVKDVLDEDPTLRMPRMNGPPSSGSAGTSSLEAPVVARPVG